MTPRRAIPVLLSGVMLVTATANSHAALVTQTIYNKTGAAVNDLHLVFFGGPVTDVTSGKKEATKVSGTEWDFKSNNFFTVQNGDNVPIKFDEGNNRVSIDRTNSYWTFNGTRPIISDVSMLGQPPGIDYAFDPTTGRWAASAVFTDPETVGITYENIVVYLNNSLSNYNIDQFDSPTSTGIALASVTLQPGQSVTVPLGEVAGTGYEFLATDAVTGSSSSELYHYGVASSVVPEPSAFLLLCTGGMTLVAIRRRRVRPS